MGRKKENRIYSMFEYDEHTKKSKCLMDGCNHYIKGNHGANLLRHFFSQHRAKYNEIVQINLENKENMPQQPSRSFKSVMDCCTNLVTIHGRPFSLLEDEAFKELLKLIPDVTQKDQQAINIKNIKENIQAKAHKLRLQISKELNNCLLALKVDVASVKLRRFLGLNIQYISNGKIILRNLSVVELHDRNTGDYLKENVAIALSRFGIELKQILTITIDNGSNMLRMVNRIDDSVNEFLEESINESLHALPDECAETHEVSSEDNENFDLQVEADDVVVRKVTSIRCAAHCFQLAVKDACQELQGFFETCRQIIRDLRTPNMYLRITQQGLSHAVLDMPVRWDSTVNMLESLKKLKSFCMANLSSITPDIWSSLDKYLEILEPCRCFSKTLQKEQLTIGDFYISWMRCRHQVSQIDDPFARHLQTCMTNRQAILFENDQFVAAIYLDPRVNSSLTTEQMTRARIHLTDIYERMIQLKEGRRHESEGVSDSTSEPGTSRQGTDSTSEPGTSRQGTDSTSEPGTSRQGTSSFEDYLRQQFVNNNTIRQQRPNEQSLRREITFKLVEFLQEPLLPSDSNILHYWEKKKLTDPYLFQLAKVVLATPPTSVSVERLFSSLKFILNSLRMRLNDAIIEDIMLVRNNYFYSN